MVETSEEVEHPKAEGKSKTCSVWVNEDKLKAFKAAVDLAGTVTYSMELNTFFDRRTRELKGLEPNSPNGLSNSAEEELARRQQYELNKKRIFDLQQDILKMVKFLKDQHSWDGFLETFAKKYVDYDGTFDPPEPSSWGSERKNVDARDSYGIRFIEEASDREADFKRETARFLMRNTDVEFVYDWVSFVEKLRERRKLSRMMLMYQMDSLDPEQRVLLQKEEDERKQAREGARRAKAEKAAKAKELERSQQEAEDAKGIPDEEEEPGDDIPEDPDEEDDGLEVAEPHLPGFGLQDDKEQENEEKPEEKGGE